MHSYNLDQILDIFNVNDISNNDLNISVSDNYNDEDIYFSDGDDINIEEDLDEKEFKVITKTGGSSAQQSTTAVKVNEVLETPSSELNEDRHCIICELNFSSKNNLIKHIRENHKQVMYQCYKCDNFFKYKQCLKNHIYKYHKSCCNYSFLDSPIDINCHAKNDYVIVTKSISRKIKHKFHISYPKYRNVHFSISKCTKIYSTVIKYRKVVKKIKSKVKDFIKDIKSNIFKSTNK